MFTMRAWTLCASAVLLVGTGTFRGALTKLADSCAEIKSAPFSGVVTSSGRVWRKMPESEARSVCLRLSLIQPAVPVTSA